MPAVGHAHGPAHAEAALGEVQSVAHRAPDAVVGHPAHMVHVHAALEDEVFQEPPDGVVHERRHHRRAQPEAALQSPCYVVLAPALPGAEAARRVEPTLARVQQEHDLAERDEVELAFVGGP